MPPVGRDLPGYLTAILDMVDALHPETDVARERLALMGPTGVLRLDVDGVRYALSVIAEAVEKLDAFAVRLTSEAEDAGLQLESS